MGGFADRPLSVKLGTVSSVVMALLGLWGLTMWPPAPEVAPTPGGASSPAQTPPVAAPEPEQVRARVIDGDTVALGGVKVRLTGIDTPEDGQCGSEEAAGHLRDLLAGAEIVANRTGGDDRDRYGRLLRYLDADGVDVGLRMIEDGYAVARYDSRDGYPEHDRQPAYVGADEQTETTLEGDMVVVVIGELDCRREP